MHIYAVLAVCGAASMHIYAVLAVWGAESMRIGGVLAVWGAASTWCSGRPRVSTWRFEQLTD